MESKEIILIEATKSKHYIRIDDKTYVVKSFSEVFELPSETDIQIGEGGRHFKLNGEINPPLFGATGAPLYKWDGTQIIETTDEEKQAYIDALPLLPKTETEQMREEMDELGQQLAQEKISNMQKTNTLNNLGQELTLEKLANMEKTAVLNSLGEEVANLKLQIMILKGGAN